jgi:DNA invertase Pin-like site-specific DNA recombinase
MDQSQRKGWGIVLSGSQIDTLDATSRFSAHVMSAAAEFESALVSMRTKEGMAQKKREGQTFGRVVAPEFMDTYRTVLAMVAKKQSYNFIAPTLNAKGIQTARWGR